jgi:hypothetical protein
MVKFIEDDRAAGRIEYVGNWEPINDGTRTLRRVVDWGASATFRFNGVFYLSFSPRHLTTNSSGVNQATLLPCMELFPPQQAPQKSKYDLIFGLMIETYSQVFGS